MRSRSFPATASSPRAATSHERGARRRACRAAARSASSPGRLATSGSAAPLAARRGAQHHLIDPGQRPPARSPWTQVTVSARPASRPTSARRQPSCSATTGPGWLEAHDLPGRFLAADRRVVNGAWTAALHRSSCAPDVEPDRLVRRTRRRRRGVRCCSRRRSRSASTMAGKAPLDRWPRFAVEDVHRFAGLLVGASSSLHVAHDRDRLVSARSRRVQILVPLTSRYRPLWRPRHRGRRAAARARAHEPLPPPVPVPLLATGALPQLRRLARRDAARPRQRNRPQRGVAAAAVRGVHGHGRDTRSLAHAAPAVARAGRRRGGRRRRASCCSRRCRPQSRTAGRRRRRDFTSD